MEKNSGSRTESNFASVGNRHACSGRRQAGKGKIYYPLIRQPFGLPPSPPSGEGFWRLRRWEWAMPIPYRKRGYDSAGNRHACSGRRQAGKGKLYYRICQPFGLPPSPSGEGFWRLRRLEWAMPMTYERAMGIATAVVRSAANPMPQSGGLRLADRKTFAVISAQSTGKILKNFP